MSSSDLTPLTHDARAILTEIWAKAPSEASPNLVLQLLSTRSFPVVGGPPSHRVMLSDGLHYFQAAFSQELYQRFFPFGPSRMHKRAIVCVDEISVVLVGEMRILTLKDMHFIEDRKKTIGVPVRFNLL